MRRKMSLCVSYLLIVVLSLSLSGCTFIFQKGRRNDASDQISKLQNDLDELQRAKKELEDRLKNEIADKEVSVERVQKGLVITFVAEVLFDSGKAELRKESYSKLDKIVSVINEVVPDLNIGIEGHTDNEPIKKSGWKSNWELSSHRALSVLHYLSEHSVSPERLAATGYGEYHPVDANDTKEGRQKNRRVEIVILPKIDKEKGKEVAP
ncbi:MAG: OmpA family protein [Candidatus Omnitrophica bacterium]|nr:OmpA family protein [Candidatus Omnitrophota bacterium]